MCVLRRIADIANAAAKRSSPLARFTKPADKQVLLSDAELSDLTDAVSTVTPEHLAVHRHDFIDSNPSPHNLISFISIANEANYAMAVIVMPPGSEIPLHDHPSMFVVSSVLWGNLEIIEYDPLPAKKLSHSDEVLAIKKPPIVLVPGLARSLTPQAGNIHSFHTNEWTAVFDVLVPPYDFDIGRRCSYYTPVDMDDTDRVILKESACPDTYYTTSVEYKGVEV